MDIGEFLKGVVQSASPVPGGAAQPRAAQPRPAPVADDATARAERLGEFLPGIVPRMGAKMASIATPSQMGATLAQQPMFMSGAGTVASIFGATDRGAELFRAADEKRAARSTAAQAPAPNEPTTEAPQSGVQVTNLSSPENAAARQQLRPLQVLSELNTTQLQALQSTLPEIGTPMAPKDRTIEDVRQIAFSRYEQVLNDETASVEMKSAATQELLTILMELSGANSVVAMAGQ